jgi:hypothetical protein
MRDATARGRLDVRQWRLAAAGVPRHHAADDAANHTADDSTVDAAAGGLHDTATRG